MPILKRVPAEQKSQTCQHPDAKSGEVWVTNKPTEGAAIYAEQHKFRVGTTAYNKLFAVVPDFQPIFAAETPNASHSCQGYCNHKSDRGLKV